MANESLVIIQQQPANLQIVTGGAQGPVGLQGTPGLAGNVIADRIAAVALGGHRMVTLDASGQVIYASADTLAHAGRVIGMTVGAAVQGTAPSVLKFGELTEPTWNWSLSLPVYLGLTGLLTQTPPSWPTSKFSTVIGFPVSSVTVLIGIQPSIVLI